MAAEAGESGEKGTSGFSKAAEELSTRLEKTTERVKNLVLSAFVFSLLSRAFTQLRNYMGDVLKTNDEFNAALGRLKGAALTAFQPILTKAIPIIITLINVLTQAISMIARFTSLLTGSTAEASAESAEALYDEAEALKQVGGGAGKAAKQLANFDEINQLSDSAGGGGGGGGINQLGSPDFLGGIKEQMGEIEIYLSGALLALGAVFTFTGISVPLGLGMMAVGALGLAKALSEDWDTMPTNIKNALTLTLAILGTGLLVIGAILAFSGANIPLGIGLMVAGAAALGTAAALNWNAISAKLQGPLGKIIAIGASLMFVTGLILALTGAGIVLGIGLMAAGAALLWADAKANNIDWAYIETQLQGPLGTIVAIGATLLLAVGLVLAFTGVALPLGIGLIAAAAALLWADASANGINWDFIQEKLQGPLGTIVAIGATLLLCVGLVLAFTGVGLFLGIGLIAAGAALLWADAKANNIDWTTIKEKLTSSFEGIKNIGKLLKLAAGLALLFSGVDKSLGLGLIAEAGVDLGAAAQEDWDFIPGKLAGIWDTIKNWFNKEIAPVFTVQYWTDKFSAIGEGMKAAINGALSAVETGVNWIIQKLNSLSFTLPDWIPGVGGEKFGLNIPTVSVPRLAQGAVIPPNREFLAVLGDQNSGTNIETPLDTMVAAFRQALNEGAGDRTLVLKVGEFEFGQLIFNAFSTEQARVGFSSVT